MNRDRRRISRRQFLTDGSAAALLVAIHDPRTWGVARDHSARGRRPAGARAEPRLLDLRLATAAPLADLVTFYRGQLEFSLLAASAEEVSFAAGSTRLTFVATPPTTGTDSAPFYHFAFNIPENKLLAARDWHLRRGRIIPPNPENRDPEFPDDVTHFRHWNAHSLFFWDPAGNLVEYIARHTLGSARSGPFTAADILYASEIALIVDDVPSTAGSLKERLQIEQYHRGSEAFTALGDELGLLLLMKRGRNLGFAEGKPAAVYPTSVRLRGPRAVEVEIPGFPYKITAQR